MIRAIKQCPSCPFRGLGNSERAELAKVPADWWPCHNEWPMADIQCRGHWEAQRKFGNITEPVPRAAIEQITPPK